VNIVLIHDHGPMLRVEVAKELMGQTSIRSIGGSRCMRSALRRIINGNGMLRGWSGTDGITPEPVCSGLSESNVIEARER
jgi:hypothetical protein